MGDPFYQWNVINEQILLATKKQQQWSELGWQDNFNKLIDNAYAQKTALNLVPGVKLTEAQINALNQDIVLYEEETIKLANGTNQKVLTPRVYLTKNSFLNTNFGTNSAIAAKNVTINAGGNIDSNGTIIASLEKTILNAVGNISIKND